MTDEAKRIVESLKRIESIAYQYNIDGEVLDMSCNYFEGLMLDAADLIKELSVDRDKWKRRAEAAERDIKHLLICGDLSSCHYCKCDPNALFEKPLEVCKCVQEAEWRRPCEENGGASK